ncbi:hypothetical protein ABIB57_002357 [Devosia sp. UYZn731]|jgi:hypothetical protein|uniref:hypothetical protein n=1 Tax=unclassified Devosia TaxID=196773 RepID=UPI00262FD75C|nr:hypothetical protein [Devosia sp.]MDB5536157.1 hypothetical protein [Devosia sp.]MDB5587635.1 hypothetical protein [Devosia sp.]
MNNSNNTVYIMFNGLGVATAYVMLALSVWLAPVDLSTKGYWGMGIFLLTVALVNLVKYRLDDRIQAERLYKLETAKNEKIIQDYITE